MEPTRWRPKQAVAKRKMKSGATSKSHIAGSLGLVAGNGCRTVARRDSGFLFKPLHFLFVFYIHINNFPHMNAPPGMRRGRAVLSGSCISDTRRRVCRREPKARTKGDKQNAFVCTIWTHRDGRKRTEWLDDEWVHWNNGTMLNSAPTDGISKYIYFFPALCSRLILVRVPWRIFRMRKHQSAFLSIYLQYAFWIGVRLDGVV